MTTYCKGNDEVYDRAALIQKLFYPELVEAGLKIDILFIATDAEDKPALTHNGYPAAAVVRVLGIKERTMGRGDAEIVIDEARYIDYSEAEKDALIDHEIHHIKLKRYKNTGPVFLDERGRPRLTLKKHDRQYGWFDEIAKRHGTASIEVKQAMRLCIEAKQTYFDFAGMPAFAEGSMMKRIEANAKEKFGVNVKSIPGGIEIKREGGTTMTITQPEKQEEAQ